MPDQLEPGGTDIVHPRENEVVTVDAISNARVAVLAAKDTTVRELAKQWCIQHEHLVEWTNQAVLAIGGLVAGGLGLTWWALIPALAMLAALGFFGVAKGWRKTELEALQKVSDGRQEEILRLRAQLGDSEALIEAVEEELHDVEEDAIALREALMTVLDHRLGLALRALKLGENHDTRISFYLRQGDGSPETGALVLLGRASRDPNLMSKSKRVHSVAEGCIGIAWAKGHCYRAGCPEDENERRRFHESTGFPAVKVDGLRMRSRSYLAQRLELRTHDWLGVVVLESLLPDAFAQTHESLGRALLSSRPGSEGHQIAELVDMLRRFTFDMGASRRARL